MDSQRCLARSDRKIGVKATHYSSFSRGELAKSRFDPGLYWLSLTESGGPEWGQAGDMPIYVSMRATDLRWSNLNSA